MRFLVDNQLSCALALLLTDLGHQAVHVLDIELAQVDDQTLWAYAAGIDYWCVDDQRAPEDLGQVPCRLSVKFVNFLLLYELGIFADEIEENEFLNARTTG